MCGIFGYASPNLKNSNAKDIVYNGLKRLEYRGYDSWGISVVSNPSIKTFKNTGALADNKLNTLELPNSNVAIGHTRWATHGGVTTNNAHPHYSTDKYFSLAQNGILENFLELKAELADLGYKFTTETDTEVIVRLIENELLKQKIKNKQKTLLLAVKKAFKKLKGRNTIILTTKHKQIIAVKNGSPLVIGLGDNEFYFASDTLSFADKTNKIVLMQDNWLVEYLEGEISLHDLAINKKINPKIEKVNIENSKIDKEGYEHFMLKEVVEQKHTIKQATNYSQSDLEPLVKAIKQSRNVYTVGAGTASFAAGQIAYYLRTVAGINAIELKAYEVKSHKKIFSEKDLVIAASQSGETADTLEALNIAKEKGVKIASIVNMVGSAMSRMSDFAYYTKSGPEICVCSTKVFTAKLAFGYLISKTLIGEYENAQKNIKKLAENLDKHVNDELFEKLENLAKSVLDKNHFFVLGRGQNYYIAHETALKTKEVSYKHFEAFSGGELKHGVIALIEEGTPVIGYVSNDEEQKDMISALIEVKSRGANVVLLGKPNSVGEDTAAQQNYFKNVIKIFDAGELDAIPNAIIGQIFAYYMATLQNLNPDKPRNLAKSVTVK